MSEQHKFRVKLAGMPGMETAAMKPPFDVPAAFGVTEAAALWIVKGAVLYVML